MLTLSMTNISEGIYMKKLSEYLFLWTLGGSLYYFFEIFFRGFSHWSMFILGGICMVFFTVQGQAVHWEDALWRQILRCIIFVTAMEFITGIIVNKWLHMAVWDYSNQPFQLFGQICLPFMIIFSASVFAVSFEGKDLVSNFTAVAATINNRGPGLQMVGPTQNFQHFSVFSKYVLMFDMLAGRLELFPLLILFHPGAWKDLFTKRLTHK